MNPVERPVALVRYDTGCRAIAEARSVDEVKDIRDKAIAMAAYARQAKNRDLEADAVEIRMRATRRLDQLRQAQKESIGLNRGAAYSTVAFAWVKQNPGGAGLFTGMGYHTRSNVELCLLGMRGAPARLAKDVHQVVMSPVGAHSVKPEEVAHRIERLYPGPYLELFARKPREGRTTWGNEIIEATHLREAAE
jgi:hypothetical protein